MWMFLIGLSLLSFFFFWFCQFNFCFNIPTKSFVPLLLQVPMPPPHLPYTTTSTPLPVSLPVKTDLPWISVSYGKSVCKVLARLGFTSYIKARWGNQVGGVGPKSRPQSQKQSLLPLLGKFCKKIKEHNCKVYTEGITESHESSIVVGSVPEHPMNPCGLVQWVFL